MREPQMCSHTPLVGATVVLARVFCCRLQGRSDIETEIDDSAVTVPAVGAPFLAFTPLVGSIGTGVALVAAQIQQQPQRRMKMRACSDVAIFPKVFHSAMLWASSLMLWLPVSGTGHGGLFVRLLLSFATDANSQGDAELVQTRVGGRTQLLVDGHAGDEHPDEHRRFGDDETGPAHPGRRRRCRCWYRLGKHDERIRVRPRWRARRAGRRRPSAWTVAWGARWPHRAYSLRRGIPLSAGR
ncbi:hypothetical protein [Nocardia sp. NPDC058633]|uniref:hypothetical protein n=1 Tax=Nocardia sp. NPDC058633 TaxID=3346568 RepID=UPI00365DC4D4